MLLGTVCAVLLWWSTFLYRVLDPFIVVLNAMPKIALVPIFYIWLGDMASIYAMAIAVSVFVTVLMLYTGFQGIDPDKIKLVQLFGASRWQTLTKIVLPGSVPTAACGSIATLKRCPVNDPPGGKKSGALTKNGSLSTGKSDAEMKLTTPFRKTLAVPVFMRVPWNATTPPCTPRCVLVTGVNTTLLACAGRTSQIVTTRVHITIHKRPCIILPPFLFVGRSYSVDIQHVPV